MQRRPWDRTLTFSRSRKSTSFRPWTLQCQAPSFTPLGSEIVFIVRGPIIIFQYLSRRICYIREASTELSSQRQPLDAAAER